MDGGVFNRERSGADGIHPRMAQGAVPDRRIGNPLMGVEPGKNAVVQDEVLAEVRGEDSPEGGVLDVIDLTAVFEGDVQGLVGCEIIGAHGNGGARGTDRPVRLVSGKEAIPDSHVGAVVDADESVVGRAVVALAGDAVFQSFDHDIGALDRDSPSVVGVFGSMPGRKQTHRKQQAAGAGVFAARPETELALRESEANFRGFFENLFIGAAQIDFQRRFVWVNDRYCQITGYSRDELLGGMGPGDVTFPEDWSVDREKIDRAIQGEGYRGEKRYLRKDGSLVWVHVSASAIFDAGGRFLRTAAVIEDITERREAEEALREREKELKRVLDTSATGLARCDREFRYV